jgi:hypothetical protein
MIPLRKSKWIFWTSLLTSVILSAKPIFEKIIFEYKTLNLLIITVIQDMK